MKIIDLHRSPIDTKPHTSLFERKLLTTNMVKFTSAAIFSLALNACLVEGFTVGGIGKRLNSNVQLQTAFSQSFVPRRNLVVLRADDGSETEADESPEEVTTEPIDEHSEDVSEEAENEEEEVEDELETLKREIAEMENTLKNKNRELDSIEKMGEQYTDGGYARKVAEMEEFRKSKSAASANTKMTVRASVLQKFLPILDELQTLVEKHEGDEFAKKYAALSWDFNNSLTGMGVTEYSVAEGDATDSRRVNSVEKEHSETVPKGCVIEAIDTGYEIDGNVMRMAAAVVSLGPEAEATDEAKEAESE